MDIRVLGCSGGIGGTGNRTTSLLVDHDILIDCGTGVAELEFEQLRAIDHVFLTHAHLDHIALLPLLVDTVGEFRTHPITLHATPETLDVLRRHIFNWQIWPDFTALPDAANPALVMQAMQEGEVIELAGRWITSMPAEHAVPAVGYRLSAAKGSLVFSGDTTHCEALVDALNGMDDLRYLVIETAFPDAQYDLAVAAKHLCPRMLREMLGALQVSPEVFITHLKPGMHAELVQELASDFGKFHPQVLQAGAVFSL